MLFPRVRRPKRIGAATLAMTFFSGTVVLSSPASAQERGPFAVIDAKLDEIIELLTPQPGGAEAVELFTPLLNAASSGRQFRCSVTNVSSAPLEVTVTIGDTSSTPVVTRTRTLASLESTDVATQSTSSFSFCQASYTGQRGDVIGHLANEVVGTGGDTEMVLSLPLQ